MHTETIVACCTPRGGSGGSLAIIRISGPQAFVVGVTVLRLSSGMLITAVPSHTIHHGHVLRNAQFCIDEIMVSVMHGPRTFTGEDTLEITCHNNPIIIEQVLAVCIAGGARAAQRGEFTQRALAHKKIDLLQAEAIHELVTAPTEQAVRSALAQVAGSFSHRIAAIEHQLITIIAWCEASFEFVEELGDFGAILQEKLKLLMADIASCERLYAQSASARAGVRIVLVGAANAGKSSLFNYLLGRERAIVTPRAGTTRDTIEAQLVREGSLWTLIDTAGIRETDDLIEQAGIDRSWKEAAQADLLLLVVDRARAVMPDEEQAYRTLLARHSEKVIVVYNKDDCVAACGTYQSSHPYAVTISTTTGSGIIVLEGLVRERLAALSAVGSLPFLVNERQYRLLATVCRQLEQAYKLLVAAKQPPYELISAELQQGAELLSELTGKSVSAAALDAIFREFCIGK